MKIPKFSGESHDYPEFKKMWKMVVAEYDDAQQFHFLKNEALPANLKVKVKICPDIKSAWEKLEDEFGQADVVALTVLENLAKLQLKGGSDHENFLILYDNWKKSEADLAEIGRTACLQQQRAIKDVLMKMLRSIRDRYILQSAPKWQVWKCFLGWRGYCRAYLAWIC